MTKFIPALTGIPSLTDYECDLFTLPPYLGVLGLKNPIKRVSEEFSASVKVAHPLKNLITESVPVIAFESWEEQKMPIVKSPEPDVLLKQKPQNN